jgi:general secretion pathway protein D
MLLAGEHYIMKNKSAILKYIPFIPYVMGAVFVFTGCAGVGKYVKQGRDYADAGNWEQSINVLEDAAKKDPANIEIKMLLVKTKWKASIIHMVNGQALLDKKFYDDAIVQFNKSIELNPSNYKARSLIEKAAAMKESDLYFQKAHGFLNEQQHAKAQNALKKAIELNPENTEALNALEHMTKHEKQRPKFNLELKDDNPISLKFKNTPIISIFEVLSKLTGINFIFDKDIKDNQVTLFMTDVSFDRFIDVLLETNKLNAKVVSEKTIIVYPDTSDKNKEYQELQIKTFFLTNLEAKNAVGILSKILKSQDITVNETLNSIVIRGTHEVIELASTILNANDRLPSEVLLNVEILEVSRNKEKKFGLEYSESITLGVGEKRDAISKDRALVGWLSMSDLEKLSNKELSLSSSTATLNLLKLDGDTRTLANPQIRVKNAEKASILIGERIPLRVNRRVDSATGDVTSDFQYYDVGVKLEAEPSMNLHGEVTLKLNLEVSSLGPNVGTVDDPQYSIRTRSAKSVLTILDGDSVVLGGLISDEEKETIRKIPLLGDIPFLGNLFTNFDSRNTKTDILMVINPIIIRNQTIPAPDKIQTWSGTHNSFSTRKPFEHEVKFKDQPIAAPLNTVDLIPPVSESEEKEPSVIFDDVKPSPVDEPELSGNNVEPEQASPLIIEWPDSTPFSIHVNSFRREKPALKRCEDLSLKAYKCFTIPVNIPEMNIYYRVFVGKFKTYKEAEDVCRQLKAEKTFSQDIHVVDKKWALGK